MAESLTLDSFFGTLVLDNSQAVETFLCVVILVL